MSIQEALPLDGEMDGEQPAAVVEVASGPSLFDEPIKKEKKKKKE